MVGDCAFGFSVFDFWFFARIGQLLNIRCRTTVVRARKVRNYGQGDGRLCGGVVPWHRKCRMFLMDLYNIIATLLEITKKDL